jgi:hypothetical protein
MKFSKLFVFSSFNAVKRKTCYVSNPSLTVVKSNNEDSVQYNNFTPI